MKPRQQTSGFPRVNCLVDGCKRGTTRIRPLEPGRFYVHTGTEDPGWICGEHWRLVPRANKRRFNLFLRRWRRADRDKGDRILPIIQRSWRRIVSIFDEGHIDIDEIHRLFGP